MERGPVLDSLWLLGGFFGFVLVTVFAVGSLLLNRLSRRSASPLSTPIGLAQGRSESFYAGAFRTLGELMSHPAVITPDVRRLLLRAGYRGPDALAAYQGSVWTSVAFLATLFFCAAISAQADASALLLATLCGAGLGWMLPKRVLLALARARAWRIARGLPTAVDLMVLNVEAGRNWDLSIAETARALQTAFPDLAEEFHQVNLELKAGGVRTDVLWALADRCGDPEIRKFVALLVDTDRFGSSLGPALRAHARYMRIRRRQKAQEAARKLSVKLVFPVFFLIFPSILLVTLGPAIIALFTQLLPMLSGEK